MHLCRNLFLPTTGGIILTATDIMQNVPAPSNYLHVRVCDAYCQDETEETMNAYIHVYVL